jgi:putative ABC transport system permease protein
MDIGDTILFKIQGVPLKARISSIRTRIRDSMSPFFYFVFQEEILKSAPQTVFSALRVEKHEVSSLQNRIVKEFPNISVVDLSDTIQVFAKFMKQLSTIVRGFSLLSIAAGVLILISAVFATRAERITESVYYKILGAKKMFVVKTFAMENVLMGLLSGLLALAISQIGAWAICRFVLEIDYYAFAPSCLVMIGIALIIINVIGIFSAKSILEKKPISFLREQPEA